MKKLVGYDIGTYSFNPTGSTITLSGLQTIGLEQVLLIVNKTYNNTIIYNFADTTKTGSISNNIITLTAATSMTGMLNTDKLLIYLDLNTSEPVPLMADYKSPDDFTAAFTTSNTITLTNLPITITDSSQIRYIKQVTTGNTSRTFFNGFDGCTMQIVVATGVITIYGVGTPFLSGDVYEVGLSGIQKAYDSTFDVVKTIDQAPIWSRYTDVESILSAAQTITTGMTDIGPEIDCRGYKFINIFIKCTVQTSTGITLSALFKHTSAGSEEYDSSQFIATTGIETVSKNQYVFPDGINFLYNIPITLNNCVPFIQLQIKHTAVGATPATCDTLYICKGY